MLYIRTDVNEIIATGHVMRCLSIADAARKQGEGTTFILADENGENLIRERGYQTIILHTKWDEMERELPVLKNIIKENGITTLLIDTYQVTRGYLDELSSYVKTIYIDDFAQEIYPVTALICYMSHWKKLRYIEGNRGLNRKLLLGMKYVPVREVFQNLEKKEIKSRVNSILLLSGGTDPYNVLSEILDTITEYYFNEIVVICGRYYENIDELIEKNKGFNNIKILKSIDNIEDYMKKADVAISAGGTTLYELCACGTPTISYAFADNQIENVKGFAENEMIEYAGDVRYDNIFENIKVIFEKYSESVEIRERYSRKMQETVDGKGATRIVKEWKKLSEETF